MGQDTWTIGEVAARSGVPASTLRYYEQAGLLPPPPRRNGRRAYPGVVFGYLALIRRAQEAGFTLAEIRQLLYGFESQVPPAVRWEALAARKAPEVAAWLARAQRMQEVLATGLTCACRSLAECAERLSAAGAAGC